MSTLVCLSVAKNIYAHIHDYEIRSAYSEQLKSTDEPVTAAIISISFHFSAVNVM